jgi:uncharacterized membrane protein
MEVFMNWTRAQLKTEAKAHFRANYGTSVLFFFLLVLVAAGCGGTGVLIPVAGGIVAEIFLILPLEVSAARFTLDNREGPAALENFVFCFKSNYVNILKTMFMMFLFVSLWSLLFVIPGIVKAYEYRLVPYLLAENPDMDYHDALETSRRLTDGQKSDIFVLDLSFIGWIVVSGLTCGIVGIFWVAPYMAQTNAALYAALYAAIRDGAATPGGYYGGERPARTAPCEDVAPETGASALPAELPSGSGDGSGADDFGGSSADTIYL